MLRVVRLVPAVVLASAVLSATSARAAGLTCAGGASADPCVISTQQNFSNAGVQTFDLGGRALVIANGGRIKVTPGGMSIVARSLEVQGTGSLVATGAGGTAGTIAVTTTGDIRVTGTMNASASTTGGQVTLQTSGALQVDGTITAEGTGASGTGGGVTTVAGKTTTVSAAGLVLAAGGTAGGRVVLVSGQDLRIADGTGARVDVSGADGGAIQLWTTSTGAVLVDGILKVSATENAGIAGRLDIDSAARVTFSSTAIVKAQGGQIGGNVDVDAAGPIQLSTAGGVAATIDVSGRTQAGNIELGTTPGSGVALGGVLKSAGSTGEGAGGAVTVQSGLDVTFSGTAPVSVTGGTGSGSGGELSVAAATSIVVNGPVAATGADGGRITLQAGTTLSTGAILDVSASGGFAGLVSLTTLGGDATIGAAIRGTGDEQGGSLDVSAHGNLTVGAAIDLSGLAPDGSGGAFDLQADGAFTQNAALNARARGTGCGLNSEITAAGTLSLGAVDVSGDTCGGTLAVVGYGLVTAGGEVDADGTNGFAGALDLSGGDLRVSGYLHAVGTDSGGQVALRACDLTLFAGSRVTATGPSARNLLQTNATMTIAGAVLGGTNTLQYAGQAPVVQATGSVLPGTTAVRVASVPCGAPATTTTSTSSSTTSSSTSSSTTSSSSSSSSTTTSSSSTSVSSTTSPTTTTSSTAPDGSTPTTTVTSTTATTSTTSVTSTSSTSSSSTSSSSTSSSSTSSSSTSVTATSSTTSTTAPPFACTEATPEACDDGDACTEDVCADNQCVNLPAEGIRAVACPLEVIAQTLRAAAPEDVGGAKVRARMLAKIAAVARAAGAGDAPRGRAALKRAARQLGVFTRAVERGIDRGTVRADVGYRITAQAHRAAAQLAALLPSAGGR